VERIEKNFGFLITKKIASFNKNIKELKTTFSSTTVDIFPLAFSEFL
jgi:hypothetical protein